MAKIAIELTKEPIIGNAGLLPIGELLRICGIDKVCAHRTSRSPLIPDTAILRTVCGLISMGKTCFDHIRQFIGNTFFSKALGIDAMPSEATLRQRFESMSTDRQVHEALPGCTMTLLKAIGYKPPVISVPGFTGVRLDTDGTLLDNSNTKKEGIEKAYNGVVGYSATCTFLEGGLIVGAELHPGSHHAMHEGSLEYHADVRRRLRLLTGDSKVLWVSDAAFDCAAFMAARNEVKDAFIIRHNLRQETAASLAKLAKQEGQVVASDPDRIVTTGSQWRDRTGVGRCRLVYELHERIRRDGRVLLVPEYKFFSVWTNLAEASESDILQLYRDRGTSEQYFAELKGELDLERLPSGKFCVNELYFLVGALVNNLLRVLGLGLLVADTVKVKKVSRRRIRTVLQGFMYLCGRMVCHARRLVLKVISNGGFGEALMTMYRRLQTI